MILVYSTSRSEDQVDGRGRLISKAVPMATVKKLLKWVKKYEKFGAYADVRELKRDQYDVDVYCPKIYIDKLGNMAIKPHALLRSTLKARGLNGTSVTIHGSI
jgi:hypothetical protein